MSRARRRFRISGTRALLLHQLAMLGALAALCASATSAQTTPAYVLFTSSPDLPAPVTGQLQSALSAELVDLAGVELSRREAQEPVSEVLIRPLQDGLALELTDAHGVRNVPRVVAQAAPELLASQIASMVRAFVVAQLEAAAEVSLPTPVGEPPLAERREEAAPTPAPWRQERVDVSPRTSSPKETWRLRVAATYTGMSYARQLAWWSGPRLEAALRLWNGWYGGATYAFHVPTDLSGAGLRVRVSEHEAGGLVGFGRTGRVLGMAADLGAGFTRLERKTTQAILPFAGTPSRVTWGGSVSLRVHGRVRLPRLPRWSLDLAPALELVLGGAPLVAEGKTESSILSPRSLRARVDVGAAWELW